MFEFKGKENDRDRGNFIMRKFIARTSEIHSKNLRNYAVGRGTKYTK